MESENLLQIKSIGVENEIASEKEQFFTVSVQKLIIMVVFTMGLYYVYWFYKNYMIIKKNTQSKTWPIARGFFYVFFTHDLFKSISATIIEKEIESDFYSRKEASTFVGLVILQRLIERFMPNKPEYIFIGTVLSLTVFFLSLFPLCKVQKLINQINGDPEGSKNSKITLINIFFILLGSVYWVFLLLGLSVSLKMAFNM